MSFTKARLTIIDVPFSAATSFFRAKMPCGITKNGLMEKQNLIVNILGAGGRLLYTSRFCYTGKFMDIPVISAERLG